MNGHAHEVVHGAFATSAVMWLGMMATMMAPTVWPWVRAYHRFNGAQQGAEVVATIQFASGYLLTWLVYAIGAALLQRVLQQTALMGPSGDAAVPHAAGVILLVAGAY